MDTITAICAAFFYSLALAFIIPNLINHHLPTILRQRGLSRNIGACDMSLVSYVDDLLTIAT